MQHSLWGPSGCAYDRGTSKAAVFRDLGQGRQGVIVALLVLSHRARISPALWLKARFQVHRCCPYVPHRRRGHQGLCIIVGLRQDSSLVLVRWGVARVSRPLFAFFCTLQLSWGLLSTVPLLAPECIPASFRNEHSRGATCLSHTQAGRRGLASSTQQARAVLLALEAAVLGRVSSRVSQPSACGCGLFLCSHVPGCLARCAFPCARTGLCARVHSCAIYEPAAVARSHSSLILSMHHCV